MKRPYQITSVVLTIFAAWVARESIGMEYMTPLGPGPGFFPLWMSILLAISAGVIFFQATFKSSGAAAKDLLPSRTGALRISAVVLALVAVVVLLQPLGFRLTMLAFQAFLLSSLARQNPVVTAVVSVLGSFGLYEVFVNRLDLPLPVGEFGI